MLIFQLASKHLESRLYLKGGKGGGDNGAGAAADAQRYSAELQDKQFNRVMDGLKPFTPLAQQYIGQLQGLSTLEGQENALSGFFNSGLYKSQSDQARNQILNSAEATGGLSSTAIGNQMSSIAPTLGQQWLGGQMQNYNNLANIGLGALQGQASAGQSYANNMSQISQQGAALAAANANRSSGLQQGLSGALSGGALGYGISGMLGASGPWGAGIGAGIGLLGSLF